MNQAAFLQIWSQPANSPTTDSSINRSIIDSSPDSGTLDSRFANCDPDNFAASNFATRFEGARELGSFADRPVQVCTVKDSTVQVCTVKDSTVQGALYEAASQLQAHLAQEEGDLYRLEDLQQVLMRWLESSIECLVEDALFHTLEGDRTFAFNRRAFERQMQFLRPLLPKEEASVSPASDASVPTAIAA